MKSNKVIVTALTLMIVITGVTGFGLIFNELAQAQGVPEVSEPGIAIPTPRQVPETETEPEEEVAQPEIVTGDQSGAEVQPPATPAAPSVTNEEVEDGSGITSSTVTELERITPAPQSEAPMVTTPVINTQQPTQAEIVQAQAVTPRSGGLEVGLGLLAFSVMSALLWYYHKHGNVKSVLQTNEAKLPKQKRSK